MRNFQIPTSINKTRSTTESLSKSLSEYYIRDLIYEGKKRVFYYLDSPLRLIPFHALKHNNKYLIEELEISYLPSFNSFFHLKKDKFPNSFIGFETIT